MFSDDDGRLEPLLHHLQRAYGVSPAESERLVLEVMRFFDEEPEAFVRRRHRELQAGGVPNGEAYGRIAAELAARPVRGPRLSERQVRRVIYG